MSTSCLFHLQVWPSSASTSDSLNAVFSRFLDDVGLSSELRVERGELGGVAVLRATSAWSMGISDAARWVPDTEAKFGLAMHAVDPACEVSFMVRYPDEEAQDLADELETAGGNAATARRVEAFFSYDKGSVSTGRDTIWVPVANVERLAWRLFAVGDFFGVVDSSGSTLQAMLEKNGRVWLDFPVPKEGGSYGKFVRSVELAELVRALPEQLGPTIVEGLSFTPFPT